MAVLVGLWAKESTRTYVRYTYNNMNCEDILVVCYFYIQRGRLDEVIVVIELNRS